MSGLDGVHALSEKVQSGDLQDTQPDALERGSVGLGNLEEAPGLDTCS